MNEYLFYLISPELQALFLPLKILFLFITLLFVGFIIFFLIKTRWLKLVLLFDLVEFCTMKIYGGVITGWRWRYFRWKLFKLEKIDYRKVVIKCHDLLDVLLVRLVPLHQANTFAERLAKVGGGTFTTIDDLWWSHELYRSIKKDPHTHISLDDLKRVLKAFDQAFKDLEVI